MPIKGPMAQWLLQDEVATLEDSMLVADALRHVPWWRCFGSYGKPPCRIGTPTINIYKYL